MQMGRANQTQSTNRIAGAIDLLGLGRDAYQRREWHEAYRQLALADEAAPLGVEDIERLARSAYLAGRDEDYLRALDRAHHAHLDDGDFTRAARAAFWLGLRLDLRGKTGPAAGWFGRAEHPASKKAISCFRLPNRSFAATMPKRLTSPRRARPKSATASPRPISPSAPVMCRAGH